MNKRDNLLKLVKIIRDAKSEEEAVDYLLKNYDVIKKEKISESKEPWFIKLNKEIEQEKEKMRSGVDYIEWVVEYAKKNNGKIYDIDCESLRGRISNEDLDNMNRLKYFVEMLNEYARDYGLSIDSRAIRVEYNDILLETGNFHGQGTVSYAQIISANNDETDIIDYNKLIKYYIKMNNNSSNVLEKKLKPNN